MTRIENIFLHIVYAGLCTVAGLTAATIVFVLAYAQEVAFWNWSVSLGPDLYIGFGMALFAFVVTFHAYWRER